MGTVREIIVLNLAGESEKAVEYLSKTAFHFREGSSRVRDITVDAHLLLGKKYLAEKKYSQALEQFLLTTENTGKPESKSNQGDMRTPQINYFIGMAYEALGNKAKAKSYFTLSANQPIPASNYIRYYQGLSYLKLGNKVKASEYFNSLIEEGNKLISAGSEVDFFAKFGQSEAGNVKQSNYYLLKGLGYKGVGDTKSATENLKKAVELSASNLFAKVELE
jgi:hypothetical protein